MGLKYVPTLYPSDEEFKNPIEYLSSPKVKSLGDHYGMIKLCPPSSFKPPLSINESKFKFIPRIQKLKELNITNRCRLFFYKQLLNFNKMNKKSLPKETFSLINTGGEEHKLFYYDFFIEVVRFYKQQRPDLYSGKSLPNIRSNILLNDDSLWTYLSNHFQIDIESLQRIYNQKLIHYFNFLSAKPEFTNQLIQEKYPTSLLYDQSDDSEDEDGKDKEETDEDACLVCEKNSNPQDTLLCDSCDKPFHKYCLSPPLSKIPEDNWFCDNCVIGNGYYGFKDSSIQYSLKDFKQLSDDFDNSYFPLGKPNSIQTLESQFWSLCDDIDNDLKVNYGADIHNLRKGEVSGFPTKDFKPSQLHLTSEQYDSYVSHPMNLNNLPYDPKSLLNYLDVDISGMTIPWIYIGNTFSTFCWHVEDQYTLSANYQHLGSTKKWYSIPSKNALNFENYMKNLAPDLFAKQPDILHQLITLVSPFELNDSAGIECFTADQEPGEYIITYPRVYHAGFNAGFNFNEAVNFTMNDWLDFGIQATNNYKKNLDKVSVFDIYEMIINILNSFKNDDKIDLELVKKGLDFLKPKLTDELSLQSTILDKLSNKPIIPKNMRRKSIVHGEDIEEDGVLCSQCKGFCTFSYILHYEPIKQETTPQSIASSSLPTPRSSPENLEDSTKRRSSKRIKLQKDQEYYKPVLLCLDDYLQKQTTTPEKDQVYLIKDVEGVKGLINDVQIKLGKA